MPRRPVAAGFQVACEGYHTVYRYNGRHMRLSTERAVVAIVMAISLVMLVLQAFVLRPRMWPAGPGLALSGDTVMGSLATPKPFAVIRPPDVSDLLGKDVSVIHVVPGGAAERAGLREGDVIAPLPASAADVLRI